MLSRKEGAEAGSRAVVFAFGGAVALALFALLAWDLGHHRTPYVPGSPINSPSPWAGYLPFFWLFYLALMTWVEWLRSGSKANPGRRRKPLTIAVVSAATFVLYGAVILALLAQLGWDPWAAHRTPYFPGSLVYRHRRWFGLLLILLAALQAWLGWRNRKSAVSNGWWPRRNFFVSAPEPDNAGAIRAHPSESANGDPRM